MSNQHSVDQLQLRLKNLQDMNKHYEKLSGTKGREHNFNPVDAEKLR
jgi:hypothetical protein